MLLKNPNLESDWEEEKSHRALVIPYEGQPYERDVGNIFTPAHWLTWYCHKPGESDQPEVRDARTSDRVLEGLKGILLFTFSRKHDGGFLQQVKVEKGKTYRFTAWAHAWSNHKDKGQPDKFPHPDDSKWSEGAGYDKAAYKLGSTNDDAKKNFTFAVGIDPMGGTNPLADTVIWGDAYHIYNWYVQELSAEAVAESDTITVFLRSKTLWSFKHNDAYWDNASLTEVDVRPTRGLPRCQYPRTYVLLPPDANSNWALAVIDATWNDKRFTLGSSADDAGIGDLDERNVLAVNPDRWPTDLQEFFDTYYPGVVMTPIEASSPERLKEILAPSKVILMKDPRWASTIFCGSLTIRAKGCWICCCAMALRRLGINTGATPLDIVDVLDRSDYNASCSMLWSAMPKLGLRVVKSTTNLQLVKDHLAAGGVCFAEVSPTSLQHFVFVSSDPEHMRDPLTGYDGKITDKYTDVDSWRLIAAAEPSKPASVTILPGVHDEAGAEWLESQGIEGYCTIAAYLGTSPRRFNLGRYNKVKFLIRLSYSYATDDPGGQGGMPPPNELNAFLHACKETIKLNPEAVGFIFCNEMNNSREWPEGYALTPDYYLNAYNSLWMMLDANDKLFPGCIDPYNAGWGDWRVVWRDVLDRILGADGLAFHAYTHGVNFEPTKVFGDDPLIGVGYNLNVLDTQQEIIPARFRHLPQYVTECNHWTTSDNRLAWEEDSYQWVLDTYEYFSARDIIAACLFRYDYEDWSYKNNASVLRALKEV